MATRNRPGGCKMPRWKWATLLVLGALVVGEFLQAETSTLAGIVRGLFWLLLATAGSLVFVGTVLWAIRSMGVRLRLLDARASMIRMVIPGLVVVVIVSGLAILAVLNEQRAPSQRSPTTTTEEILDRIDASRGAPGKRIPAVETWTPHEGDVQGTPAVRAHPDLETCLALVEEAAYLETVLAEGGPENAIQARNLGTAAQSALLQAEQLNCDAVLAESGGRPSP